MAAIEAKKPIPADQIEVSKDDTVGSDKNRQYPVKIDPTLTWFGTDQLKDVYVCNGSNYKTMNFYNSDIVITMAGKAAQGVYRSHMKFTDLKTLLANYYIDSASLTLYEAANSQSGQTITAHQVTASWTMDKITWNNRPSYNTTALSSFTTSGKSGTAKTLDVKKLITNMMVNGDANYGLMIRNKSESSSYGKFYGTRNTTSSKRPKLSIIVSDKPATPSKLTVSPTIGKPGDNVTVKWEGISSSSLSRVEYRICRLDAAGVDQGNIVNYTDTVVETGGK
ncbi:MAG: DNRLRE domain-containing protein [Lachnospiraceae bacterium]|nr:DNRLRE domain-containing protein [Lachnospiraceae bacterium]